MDNTFSTNKLPNPAYLYPPKMEPTLAVRNRASGRLIHISPERYDPARHEKVEKTAAPAPRVRAAAPSTPTEVSSTSEDTMGRMSLAALKELPEFQHVQPTWRNKQELIQAILAVRSGATED